MELGLFPYFFREKKIWQGDKWIQTHVPWIAPFHPVKSPESFSFVWFRCQDLEEPMETEDSIQETEERPEEDSKPEDKTAVAGEVSTTMEQGTTLPMERCAQHPSTNNFCKNLN